MARKVKRKRIAQKRRTIQRAQKKTNKNNSYLAMIVVIIAFAFIIYYFGFSKGLQQPYPQREQPSGTTPTTSGQGASASVGGFCEKDSQCFIAYCKGQAKNCINATQMATYANDKCRTYSDFVIENKQDYSVCACVQNACTLK